MIDYGWPFKGPYKITCKFGVKGTAWKAGYHSGLDIVSDAAGGDGVVYPIAEGTVLRTSFSSAYGVFVSVLHPDGYISLYAHLTSYIVVEGKPVHRGTPLGFEGATGNVSGKHLHLEIHKGEYHYPSTIDPEEFLNTHRTEDTTVPDYHKLPAMHSVIISPEKFKLLLWKKGKRTTTIKNYAIFTFQASPTYPVGNVIIDGKILARDTKMTTLWVDKDGHVGIGVIPPATAMYATSGIPLYMDGVKPTIAQILAEGWDDSPFWATAHSLLGVGYNGKLYYFTFTSTQGGTIPSFKELQDIAEHLGMKYVLLGDGGKQAMLDIDGKTVFATNGNAGVAVLILFG